MLQFHILMRYWNDLCRSKRGYAFFVRSSGCAFFIWRVFQNESIKKHSLMPPITGEVDCECNEQDGRVARDLSCNPLSLAKRSTVPLKGAPKMKYL